MMPVVTSASLLLLALGESVFRAVGSVYQVQRSRGFLRSGSWNIEGCHDDRGILLCEGLRDLGDGVCDAHDLDHILGKMSSEDWHGDKVQLIRSESPHGWLPVPSLHADSQLAAPSGTWQTVHSKGLYMLDGFLSEAEADDIVSQIQGFEPIVSEVDDPALPACSFRRSTTWVFFGPQREQRPLPNDLLARIESATKVPKDHYEASQIVEYKPGDFFSDHYDTSPCDHIGSHTLEGLDKVGLRKKLACDDGSRRQGTLIVYLTGDSDGHGGATYFPKLDVRIQPKKGRAIFFRPTRADGSNDPWMLHSAETVFHGRKLLLQQWMMHGSGWTR